jgi:hypothetical protein
MFKKMTLSLLQNVIEESLFLCIFSKLFHPSSYLAHLHCGSVLEKVDAVYERLSDAK